MATRLQQAEANLREARLRLDEVEATVLLLREEEKKRTLPDEPTSGMVRFEGRFNGTTFDKLYRFVAIHAGGRWYTSGSRCPASGYTWRQLVAYMRDEVRASKYQVVAVIGVQEL